MIPLSVTTNIWEKIKQYHLNNAIEKAEERVGGTVKRCVTVCFLNLQIWSAIGRKIKIYYLYSIAFNLADYKPNIVNY